MNFLVVVNIFILVLISIFHVYWAMDGKIGMDKVIPSKDGQALFQPGKIGIFGVSFLSLVFAYVVYSLGFKVSSSEEFIYAGWMISAVFILRAIGEFNMLGFFKKIKDSEFSSYDTKYFSPLSLFIGVSIGRITYLG